ncbi:MAG TPA: cell division protein CrgA [Acidimicrobiia bacterium]|nr:cell division protein CrgA [Acidimicrobiia bacterium]
MPESRRRKPKQTSATRPSNPATAAHQEDPSPTWYVATMAGLMIAGVLMVLMRFIFSLDQVFLLGGLTLIAAGFIMTTNYR